MAKRKRASPSPALNSAEPTDSAPKVQKSPCDRCLESSKKSLIVALRLGAGFERQKHSRRKKFAKSKKDSKGLARIEAEYAVLKGLNIDKVADQHLRRTVGKVKALKDYVALVDYVAGLEKGSTDPATLNVLARLYKVAAVKKAVDEAVVKLKEIIGKEERRADAAAKDDEEMVDVSDEGGIMFAAFNARIAAPSSGEEDSEGSMSDDERPPSIGDSESEHDPDDDLGAESESEDEDSFQGFSGEKDSGMDARIAPPSDVSESESDVASIPTKKTKTKAQETVKSTSSAFIPSLSHGTYIVGSDSEASDLDAGFAPCKNRRGQRARQKIAEAKHGAKAKHLEKQERDKGWDPKRGAVSDDRGRRGMKTGYGPQQSGENSIPLGKKRSEGTKRDDKGDLHPSWQAAKLAKEKKQIKIDIRAPQGQGKKVVFD
ncbi:Bud-site selection protein [Phaeosphaeriaceae sp. PMI808]|nr:Bud-site selection protein [Phaeosphaeriaceae sp. PMI808]